MVDDEVRPLADEGLVQLVVVEKLGIDEGDDGGVDEVGVDAEELVLVGEGLVDKEGVGLLPVELSVVLQGQGVDVVDEEGVDVLLV